MSNIVQIGGPATAEGVDQEFIEELLELLARARAGEVTGIVGMVQIGDGEGEELGLGSYDPRTAAWHMDIAKRRMQDAYLEMLDEPDD